MMKRLIEVALPLKEVSEQSAREKSIRHGHISTLHIWWARRPLAACRAAVFASLIPDPDDPACPEPFRTLVMKVLGRAEFRPKALEPSPAAPLTAEPVPLEDTPRNRCLEFIKYLVRWENSNDPDYIEPARTLVAAAHKLLHPGADGDSPKVIDPFSGGGAIPLEALRLGCDTTALDLNPVAHLIELCTLVYPQKYGQPGSRSVPEYIKTLPRIRTSKRKGIQERSLFDRDEPATTEADAADSPQVEISEAEYERNPLAADVKYWGHWILEKARQQIGRLYPNGSDGAIRLAYLWAHTLPCPNPACRATVPLMKQRWLVRSNNRSVAIQLLERNGGVEFGIAEGDAIDGDPSEGTIQNGEMRCPVCQQGFYDKESIKEACCKSLGVRPICTVSSRESVSREYAPFSQADLECVELAKARCTEVSNERVDGLAFLPDELVGTDFEWALTVSLFGLKRWSQQFNPRQLLALATFASLIREAPISEDKEYSTAVRALLTMAHGRLADKCAIHCLWRSDGEYVEHVFGRQALSMSWDYAEVNPFSGQMGDWTSCLQWVLRNIESASEINGFAKVYRGSATRLPLAAGTIQAVVTDPPYYDAVPYADLSDFFYVWHKRCMRQSLPDLYRTPVTPKAEELVQQSARYTAADKRKKTKEFFENGMRASFSEMSRVLCANGIIGIMFAHKTTAAWEALIQGINTAGGQVTSTWPIHTEMKARLRAKKSAALASSVLLVCRKRTSDSGEGLWDDVRRDLQSVTRERLDFFWSQGIRGADFFISAIGPALSVFGRFDRVTRLSGEEVTVGQFLDEVRGIVSNYALSKILKTTHTSDIDPESRFYVVWKWSYADAKVPADEAFKLAQALGMSTDLMWDRTGVLEKAGENVAAVTVEKRKKIKDLGEPGPNGVPASLIDVLHRLCAYREKNDTNGMAEFLARSGQAQNPSLWLVAQAVSEILPDGDKEKQLMQGLLNQKDQLDEAQGRLF